ncbi:MAG: hypothetical protein IT406_02925 [Candidatus Yanofskybacteria bacterium]|nr:hypothetical protein [Candidatus Yanofskybacteria bacterium]
MSTCTVRPSFGDRIAERDRVRRIIMKAAEELVEHVLAGNANTPIPGLYQRLYADTSPTVQEYLSRQPLAPLRAPGSE